MAKKLEPVKFSCGPNDFVGTQFPNELLQGAVSNAVLAVCVNSGKKRWNPFTETELYEQANRLDLSNADAHKGLKALRHEGYIVASRSRYQVTEKFIAVLLTIKTKPDLLLWVAVATDSVEA